MEPESSVSQPSERPVQPAAAPVCGSNEQRPEPAQVAEHSESGLSQTNSLYELTAVRRIYLNVFEGNHNRLVPLPGTGELVIGRSEEADVKVSGPAVSRRHAKLMLREHQAECIDLGSHNGTRINGEAIQSSRILVSGDTITVGSVSLIYHCSVPAQQPRTLGTPSQLRARLHEEIERSHLYHHPASLVCLSFDPARAIQEENLTALFAKRLRLIDFAAVGSRPGRLWILIPDLPAKKVEEVIHSLFPLLSLGKVRAAYAVFPSDGADGDSLVSAARSAAESVPWGSVVPASSVPTTKTIGGRSVVLVDPAMVRIYEQVQRIARSQLSVLIHGETGAGKELVARALHEWSDRRQHALVSLNCAALPDSLLESELFGFERGAFTGANQAKMGLIEKASGGTLFLDEVADLSLSAQAKLLRVLEERRVLRVGSTEERPVDIRLVAASHQHLEQAVQRGAFRKDLLYRLRGACITIPPLRERPREIPILARAFLLEFCEQQKKGPLTIGDDAMAQLVSWEWPGNVRELRSAMEYVAATADSDEVQVWHLPQTGRHGNGQTEPLPIEPHTSFRPLFDELRELERTRMQQALDVAEGVQLHAAQLVNMPVRTFYMKAKQYGLIHKANTTQSRAG